MDDSPARREIVGAWLLYVAYLIGVLGMVWDVEWHADVGPDTFFTAPHLLLYTSMSSVGLISLAVVLLTSKGKSRSASPALTVFKVFRTPLPFLVAGVGGALGLVYGLADLWWHTVYGFDVTPTSPPHVGLSLADLFVGSGAIMAMAAVRWRRSGRWGLAIMVATVVSSWTFLLYSVPDVAGLPGFVFAMAALCALLFALVIGVTRRPVWTTATGLAFAVLHAVSWVWALAATTWYATVVGLPMRDYADPLPTMPMTFPFAFSPAAIVVTVVVLAAWRWRVPPAWSMPVSGGLAAALIMAGYAALGIVGGPVAWLLTVSIGALCGWLGWHFGTMMRLLNGAEANPLVLQEGIA
jgi:hypothetical protein